MLAHLERSWCHVGFILAPCGINFPVLNIYYYKALRAVRVNYSTEGGTKKLVFEILVLRV